MINQRQKELTNLSNSIKLMQGSNHQINTNQNSSRRETELPDEHSLVDNSDNESQTTLGDPIIQHAKMINSEYNINGYEDRESMISQKQLQEQLHEQLRERQHSPHDQFDDNRSVRSQGSENSQKSIRTYNCKSLDRRSMRQSNNSLSRTVLENQQQIYDTKSLDRRNRIEFDNNSIASSNSGIGVGWADLRLIISKLVMPGKRFLVFETKKSGNEPNLGSGCHSRPVIGPTIAQQSH